jgi:hypothetical protein
MAQSYKSSHAALDDIIRRYRAGQIGRGRAALSREQAIELIKALGFTRGDAGRWLDPKPCSVKTHADRQRTERRYPAYVACAAAKVDRWFKSAAAADAEEERLCGDKRGDEMPDCVADNQKRLDKIRAAKAALQAEAKAAAAEEARRRREGLQPSPKNDGPLGAPAERKAAQQASGPTPSG